jgi:hypothetical protein
LRSGPNRLETKKRTAIHSEFACGKASKAVKRWGTGDWNDDIKTYITENMFGKYDLDLSGSSLFWDVTQRRL